MLCRMLVYDILLYFAQVAFTSAECVIVGNNFGV